MKGGLGRVLIPLPQVDQRLCYGQVKAPPLEDVQAVIDGLPDHMMGEIEALIWSFDEKAAFQQFLERRQGIMGCGLFQQVQAEIAADDRAQVENRVRILGQPVDAFENDLLHPGVAAQRQVLGLRCARHGSTTRPAAVACAPVALHRSSRSRSASFTNSGLPWVVANKNAPNWRWSSDKGAL